MKGPKFNNKSGLQFTDISSELERRYRFVGGAWVVIQEPLWLHVSDSGGHRIFDAEGRGHYIPVGWIQLTWLPKPGAPSFVK